MRARMRCRLGLGRAAMPVGVGRNGRSSVAPLLLPPAPGACARSPGAGTQSRDPRRRPAAARWPEGARQPTSRGWALGRAQTVGIDGTVGMEGAAGVEGVAAAGFGLLINLSIVVKKGVFD